MSSFDDPHMCYDCEYQTENVDKMILHVAHEHNKLEELLQDHVLVAHKRAKAKVFCWPFGGGGGGASAGLL